MANTADALFNREGNPRKRLRFSRDGPHGEQALNALQTSATASTPNNQEVEFISAKTKSGSCQHEAALNTLQHDIDAMRHLLTCQICHHFMYEPYALSCGHTYCYSCLSQWLGDNRKKTCPDCRAEIYQQPTPSYVIRELVLVFVSRNQLLPDGETSEEHNKLAKDEADIVAKDKANMDEKKGGLFRGTFKRNRPLTTLHDPSDNVERCPICHWEVEDGFCTNCGDSDSGDQFSDFLGDLRESDANLDELDEALTENDHDAFDGRQDDSENEEHIEELSESGDEEIDPAVFSAAFGNRPIQGTRNHRHTRSERRPIDISSESEDESEDEEDELDSDLREFIENDDLLTDDDRHAATYDSDDTEVQQITSRLRQRRGPPVIISDEEDGRELDSLHSINGSDDESSLASAPQRSKRARIAHRQRMIAISSDSEGSEEESDGEESRGPSISGFSPPQQGNEVADNGIEDDNDDGSTNYGDSEVPSTTSSLRGSYSGAVDDSSESDSDDDLENGWGPNILSASCIDCVLIAVTGTEYVRHESAMNTHPHIAYETSLHSRRYDAAPLHTSYRRPSGMSRGIKYPAFTLNNYYPDFVLTAASHRPSYGTIHPFNLANTLNNINGCEKARTPMRRSRHSGRDLSALSSESSIGGGGVHVRLSSSASASSGSSNRTTGPSNDGYGKCHRDTARQQYRDDNSLRRRAWIQ